MTAQHGRKIAVETPLKAVGNMNVKSQGGEFHKFKLSNGLTVLLKESHKSPVVSVQMWVRTGSADERKGEEGISHFIEHLVFKGSEKYQVGEIASVVEAAGGEINAYTTFDQTVFYVTISKEFVATSLDVISQMMGFASFEQGEIDNEREVVVEEIKRGQDSLSRQASQLLFSNTFRSHPYGKPVIGYEKVVRTVSRKKILDYFKSRYNPENMFLVVAGDVDRSSIKKLIAQYFQSIPKNKLRKVRRRAETKSKTARIQIQKSDFAETQFYMSWKVPGALGVDTPALDVLALILGQGESSRLHQKLRMENHLVNSAYATCFTPQDHGLFAISASLNSQKFAEVLKVIETFWLELLTEPVSAAELQKAIVNFRAEQYYSMETVDGWARRLGSTYLLARDPNFLKKYLQKVEQLTPADLLKAARKYLSPETINFSMLADKNPKPLEKEFKNWLKGFQKKLKIQSRQKSKGKTSTTRLKLKKYSFVHRKAHVDKVLVEPLPGGGVLLMRPNYDTPVVSIRAGFLGGVRLESPDKQGLTELLARTWTSGTGNLNEQEILRRVDAAASSLSSFGGRNTVGLSLDTLESQCDEMLDLMIDICRDPIFPQEPLERERSHLMELLKTRKDNPAQTASLLFLKNIFADHPYGKDVLGTEETLNQITVSDLRNHWNRALQQGNIVISASGAIDETHLKRRMLDMVKAIPAGKKQNQKFACKALTEPVRIFEAAQKNQTHIIYGFRGLTFTAPERFALQVLQSVLAGQGGRLFVELRDRASLAYSVAPMRMEGLDAGYFGAYIGCSPEKGRQAISMMEVEFKKLMETNVPEVELQRAQRYLIGRHDIDLQRNSSIAGGLLFDELYEVGHTEVFHFSDRIKEVTAKQVRDIAQRILSSKPVLVAVGPDVPW